MKLSTSITHLKSNSMVGYPHVHPNLQPEPTNHHLTHHLTNQKPSFTTTDSPWTPVHIPPSSPPTVNSSHTNKDPFLTANSSLNSLTAPPCSITTSHPQHLSTGSKTSPPHTIHHGTVDLMRDSYGEGATQESGMKVPGVVNPAMGTVSLGDYPTATDW